MKNAVKSPVLTFNSSFNFSCHKGLACFTQCCKDINIFLTPYDVLRMKNSLNLTSEEFLSRYTITIISENSGLPLVLLKMLDDEEHRCPFVSPDGCKIYPSRPWSCRMYPLDQDDEGKEFYFVAESSRCLGLKESNQWKVGNWLEDQGIPAYNEVEGLFNEINQMAPSLGKISNNRIRQMFYMTCYDLDKFKRFIVESKFLDIFEIGEEEIEKIKTDEIELMRFGFKWVKFGMLDQGTLKIREKILEARKREQASGRK